MKPLEVIHRQLGRQRRVFSSGAVLSSINQIRDEDLIG